MGVGALVDIVNAAFTADPVGFLRSNLLLAYQIGNSGPAGDPRTLQCGVYDFKIAERSADPAVGNGYRVQTSSGDVSSKITTLTFNDVGGAGPNPIRAYYLAWQNNASHSITLGGDADYLFTATLQGCGLVVGGSKAAPTVVHMNYYSGGVDLARTDTVLARTAGVLLGTGTSTFTIPATTLNPRQYRAGNTNTQITVIGFRRGGLWNFWYQQYDIDYEEGGWFSSAKTAYTQRGAIAQLA
jgi:hypothetical protein